MHYSGVFSFTLNKGDPSSALKDVNSIIVSEKMAEKYFQDRDPIGEIFRYDNSFDLKMVLPVF